MATSFATPDMQTMRYRRPVGAAALDPNDPNGDPTQGGDPPAVTPPAAPGIYGNPGGASIPNINTDHNQPINRLFYGDIDQIQAGGQQINQEAINQLGYYGPIQQAEQQKADAALDELKQTPGYNADEASKIGIDYGRYRTGEGDLNKQFLSPEEEAQIKGDPGGAQAIMQRGVEGEGAMLNQYQENLSGQVGNLADYTGGAMDQYRSDVGDATGGLRSGLDAAQDKFGKLDAAVNDPSLAFDPNATEKQLTDTDVQNMKTAAGTRIGNQYRSAEDTLNRQAAAAGNTSPLALAAARARLQTQSSAEQGDAEVNADIAARQSQFNRAADIEQQRALAAKTGTAFRAGAATTEEQAAQQAAALAGTTDVAAATQLGQTGVRAAEDVGAAGIQASEDYGKFSTQTAGDIANKQYGAGLTADQLAAQRAAAIANNRQQTQTGVNQTQYAQGTQTGQLTSKGAETTGNARIAGQGAYRQGVTQQQGMAQQGGQAAVGQQLGAYDTQTRGTTSAVSGRAGYETSGTGNSALNQAIKAGAAFLDDGAIVTEPTLAVVGERRPEAIVPMGRYRRERQAA